MKKQIYTAPKLQAFGKLEDMTHGNSTGTVIDASFPAGTPFGSLTFS